MKRQDTEWEKICGNHIADKRLVSEYTNNSQNSLIRKQSDIMGKKFEQTLLPVRQTNSKDESLWKCKLKSLYENGN